MALDAVQIGLIATGVIVALVCAFCVYKARQEAQEELARNPSLRSPLVGDDRPEQVGGRAGAAIDILRKQIAEVQHLQDTRLVPDTSRLVLQDGINRRIFDQLNSQQKSINEVINIQDRALQEQMKKIDVIERQEQCLIEQVDLFVKEVVDDTARMLHHETEYHHYKQRKFQETMLQTTAERAAGLLDSRKIEEQLASLRQMLQEQQRDRDALVESINDVRSKQTGLIAAAALAPVGAGGGGAASPVPASPGTASVTSHRAQSSVASPVPIRLAVAKSPQQGPVVRSRRRPALAPPRDPEGSAMFPYPRSGRPSPADDEPRYAVPTAAALADELPSFHVTPPRPLYHLPPPVAAPKPPLRSPTLSPAASPTASPEDSPASSPRGSAAGARLRKLRGGAALRPARDFLQHLRAADEAVARIEGLASKQPGRRVSLAPSAAEPLPSPQGEAALGGSLFRHRMPTDANLNLSVSRAAMERTASSSGALWSSARRRSSRGDSDDDFAGTSLPKLTVSAAP